MPPLTLNTGAPNKAPGRTGSNDNAAWHFHRFVALCALWWLLNLIPGALAAVDFAASVLAFSLAVVARCVRELGVLAFSAQALVERVLASVLCLFLSLSADA